ncbi:hypothetical protein BLNAU_17758 [Blattamonas nauphoetae]|uniref:Uncharacterized protein n=1 Tax=Blattamonas nauphoetae TaxID=2049346 RepID=A0ABQ9X694_9EUKA|nr:hypothetical protein BLNAU_17758 [Blattamonas nauphoetae]
MTQFNHLTIESVLEWLSDSSVHPRYKVNSFQWFHIPTLLTTHIQSQQEQPTKQNNEVLSQLLQRMMTILDECFDSHTPIANKRLLHTSLSQLSQSPSLDPKIKRTIDYCFVALTNAAEDPYVLVELQTLDSIDSLRKDHDTLQLKLVESETMKASLSQDNLQLHAKFYESERKVAQLEKEKAAWIEEKTAHLSLIQSLQREKEQMRVDHNRQVEDLYHTIQQMKIEAASPPQPIVASDVIVAFNPNHIRVSGSTVTQINSDQFSNGCFTKSVSKGIHRLTLKTEAEYVMFGVLDAAEYPNYLTELVSGSPKAAMMYGFDGWLLSAGKQLVRNTRPEKGQEWSAEADLEKRTLHFFIDGVQQQHHFINIPVPLVFAIETYWKNTLIEIMYWGELKKSNVTFQGSGHNLG